MASKELSITLTAKDGMSKTFKTAGDGATKLGDALEQAGQDGKRGLDQLGQSAEANTRKMDTLKAEATAIGAAMGTLAAGVAMAGAAYRDQERQIDVVNRLYEDQADAVLNLAESIQDSTRYSNDAAREAIIMFGSLSQNYEITTDQVERLTGATLDLSAAFGYDLKQTATDVSSAIRGEAEAIEKYGVAMSDTFLATEAAARGMEGWTTTMTEAEKAAFRYTILLEQVSAYQGVAAEQASGATGAFREFANEMQDAVQSVGGFLGPVGQVAAEMAPLAIAAPIVGAGLANIGRSALVARAGMGALALVTNPVALGLTAATAAGVAWYASLDDGESVLDRFDATMDDLFLENEGQNFFENIGGAIKTFATGVDEAVFKSKELEASLNSLQEMGIAAENTMLLEAESAFRSADAVAERINAGTGLIDGLTKEAFAQQHAAASGRDYQEVLKEVTGAYSLSMEAENDYTAAQQAIGAAFLETATDAELLNQDLQDLRNLFVTGAITYDQYASSVTGISDNLDDYTMATDAATTATDEHTNAIDRYLAKQRSALEILSSLEQEERENLTWQTERERTAYANQEISLATQKAMAEEGVGVLTEALTAWSEAQSVANQATMEWLSNGANILDFLADFSVGAREGTQWWGEFSREFNAGLDTDQLNRSFDAVLNVFSQIDSLASRPAAALSIVETLFGEGGDPSDGLGPLVDLLDAGRISYEQFNETIRSGIGIQANAALSQEHLNKIRVDQLPLLEQEQQAYTKNLFALSQLAPEEQRRALALQDTAVQAQIATQYSTAYAASVGEIPTEVATDMIVSAAEADPVLADLLTQFGLVEEGADGELRVNFPDGDTVEQAVTGLTNSIDALIITMGGVPPLRIEADTEEATGKIVAFGDYVLDIDGVRASMGIDADTSDATTALDTTQSLITNLDGKTATATVTVQSGNATVGDGTGGAQNWRDFLDIPEDVSTTVTATTSGGADVDALASTVADLPPSASIAVSVDAQGFAEIGSLFEMVRALDETSATITVDADTSAVDAALNQFGVFDNPTGGAAVMSPAGSVMVAFLADTSDIDDWEPPEFDPVDISIISSTHGAQIALDNITSAADNLAASQIMVRVEADTGTAVTALNDVINAANNLAISQITVNVSAEIGTAVTGLNSVTVAANAIPPSESVTVVALAEGATFALNGVTAAANAIPESESVTVTVFGAAGAVSALNSVTNAANAIPSSRSTTITTNRVTNNVQTYSTRNVRGGAYAHGGMVGVPSFAGGGMVPFWAGENGPEIAHFAHGGSALLPYEGLYAAPPMTYISPNNARGNSGAFDFDMTPMTDRIDEARAALEGFADDAPTYGDNITAGLALGIEQGAPVVSNAAIGVMGNALAAAKASAGISSPAAEWVQPGIELDNGLAQGILAGESSVVNAAVQVVQNAVAAAQDAATSWLTQPNSMGPIITNNDLEGATKYLQFTQFSGDWGNDFLGRDHVSPAVREVLMQIGQDMVASDITASQALAQFKRTYGYAHGGMVPFWAGENGPELAHFAGGGTALLPYEGMYAAPPMTYISPNNDVSNEYGGSEVNIHIHGNVYGIDDLTAQVTDKLATAIAPAMREYERGMGV